MAEYSREECIEAALRLYKNRLKEENKTDKKILDSLDSLEEEVKSFFVSCPDDITADVKEGMEISNIFAKYGKKIKDCPKISVNPAIKKITASEFIRKIHSGEYKLNDDNKGWP